MPILDIQITLFPVSGFDLDLTVCLSDLVIMMVGTSPFITSVYWCSHEAVLLTLKNDFSKQSRISLQPFLVKLFSN